MFRYIARIGTSRKQSEFITVNFQDVDLKNEFLSSDYNYHDIYFRLIDSETMKEKRGGNFFWYISPYITVNRWPKYLSYRGDPPPFIATIWSFENILFTLVVKLWSDLARKYDNIQFYKPETKSFHFRYIGPFGLNLPFLYDAHEAITCFIMFCNKKSCLFAT